MSKQILIPSNKYHFHSKFPRIFIQKSRKIAVFEPILEKKTFKNVISINFWMKYAHFDSKHPRIFIQKRWKFNFQSFFQMRSDAVTGHLKPFEAGCFLCSGFILFVNMAKWYNLSPVLPLSIPNSADHISLVTFRISFYTFNL